MLMIGAILRAYMGQSGRSSGVERNLAKVEVVGSNPIARSNIFNGLYGLIFCSGAHAPPDGRLRAFEQNL